MLFCKKCNARVYAAYCTICGEGKLALPQMRVTPAEPKPCSSCEKPVNAAYCTSCGTARNMNINFGIADILRAIWRAAHNDTVLPVPIEWFLMGVMLLFALSTMTFWGGLMLISALVPAAAHAYDKELYAQFKLKLGVWGAGLGFVFAIFATFTGVLRLNYLALLLCALGLTVIALISAREMIMVKLPWAMLPYEAERVISFIEGPMYFYIVAIYFAVATVFLRVVHVWSFLLTREFASAGIGAGRVLLSLIFVAVLLVPVAGAAFIIWRGMTGLIDKALVALGGSAVFAVFVIPIFFRRIAGVPSLFVLSGFAGIAAVGFLLFTYKDGVMKVFTGVDGEVSFSPEPTDTQTTHWPASSSWPEQSSFSQPFGAMSDSPDDIMSIFDNPKPRNQPIRQLKTNRNLFLLIILSAITLGIYPIVLFSSISTDINTIAQPHDDRRTMHFCLLAFIIAPITLGIGAIVWYHKLSDRVGNELRRRGFDGNFGAGTYWLWSWFGILLFGLGPLIYLYKLLQAMNLLSAHYNLNG